jgi:hypothetical protein
MCQSHPLADDARRSAAVSPQSEQLLRRENDMKLLEREAGVRYIADAAEVGRLIEDCISSGSRAALLHADNLPRMFFDLSSGQAGAILQRLRTYRVRLAVVAPKERVVPSPRFVDMVAEERRSGQFALFETRDAAASWLVTGEHEVIPS